MIKVILFDCDGPIIKRDKYFSQRLMDLGYKLDSKKIQDFFVNEFLLCETGKADLKEELQTKIKDWGWHKTLEELLDFWFSGEAFADPKMLEFITEMRNKGIKCHLATDQEKYRAEYLWEIVGLQKTLESRYSSSDIGFLKRDKGFWEEVYKDFQDVSKNEVLVIDDDQMVINSAKDFGFEAEFFEDFEDFRETMLNKYKI